jgi:uncharacterized protein (DUF697 family)
VPGWNDFGSVFSTLRELDVSAIREESERTPQIAVVGPRQLFKRVVELLRTTGSRRYGPAGHDPLRYQPLSSSEPDDELRGADLLLALVDGRHPLDADTAAGLAGLARLAAPTVIAICGIAAPGDPGPPRPEFAHARIVILPDLDDPQAAGALADALIERLAEDLRLAAVRAVPGLRPTYARELLSSVSFTNASYSFATAIPEQIPILSFPFAAADLIVLTKNQALMVYRLALAHGASPDFQARMTEIIPVIGGGFIWRQVARTLIGLVPFWGIVPKVAVAYAGTYTTGMLAWRWFAEGEIISGQRLKELADDSLRQGRERATALLEAAQAARNSQAKRPVRSWWPGRK